MFSNYKPPKTSLLTEILKIRSMPKKLKSKEAQEKRDPKPKLRIEREQDEEDFGWVEDFIRKYPPLNEDFRVQRSERKEAKEFGAKSWEISQQYNFGRFSQRL